MKYRSKKTEALYREWEPARILYLDTFPCAVCGGPPSEIHEILAGTFRLRAFVEPACWLAVCRTCHNMVQGLKIPNQLALKLIADPATFDLVKFHKVWDRPLTAVTLRDIAPYLEWANSHG